MHYFLSSVYAVTIPLHVSDLLVARHQEVTMYTCNNWYVLYVHQAGFIHAYIEMHGQQNIKLNFYSPSPLFIPSLLSVCMLYVQCASYNANPHIEFTLCIM
jgi:hypothetical protein